MAELAEFAGNEAYIMHNVPVYARETMPLLYLNSDRSFHFILLLSSRVKSLFILLYNWKLNFYTDANIIPLAQIATSAYLFTMMLPGVVLQPRTRTNVNVSTWYK